MQRDKFNKKSIQHKSKLNINRNIRRLFLKKISTEIFNNVCLQLKIMKHQRCI